VLIVLFEVSSVTYDCVAYQTEMQLGYNCKIYLILYKLQKWQKSIRHRVHGPLVCMSRTLCKYTYEIARVITVRKKHHDEVPMKFNLDQRGEQVFYQAHLDQKNIIHSEN